jgi:DNA-binding transcriptional ArsR family regulator
VIPTVAALSPLAARVGVADWILDLVRAGLFSVSANGLGAFLLAFAGHDGSRARAHGATTDADRDQASVASLEPGPPPGGRGKRRKRQPLPPSAGSARQLPVLPANVVPIGNRHQILNALASAGRPMTVSELARAMKVTRGEASRRWREAGDLVDTRRDGKFVVVSLRRTRAG